MNEQSESAYQMLFWMMTFTFTVALSGQTTLDRCETMQKIEPVPKTFNDGRRFRSLFIFKRANNRVKQFRMENTDLVCKGLYKNRPGRLRLSERTHFFIKRQGGGPYGGPTILCDTHTENWTYLITHLITPFLYKDLSFCHKISSNCNSHSNCCSEEHLNWPYS